MLFWPKISVPEYNSNRECCWPYLIGRHPSSPAFGQMRGGTPEYSSGRTTRMRSLYCCCTKTAIGRLFPMSRVASMRAPRLHIEIFEDIFLPRAGVVVLAIMSAFFFFFFL